MAETKSPKIQNPHRVTMNTPQGRVSYPYLAAPDAKASGKPYADDKYKLSLLVPKTTDLATLKAACVEVASKTWPALWASNPKSIQMPIKDGDKKDGKPEYAGHYVLTAKTTNKPQCVDAARNVIEPQLVYAGSWARMNVTVAPYLSSEKVRNAAGELEVQTMHGVTLYLNAVQFIKDGESFGGVSAKAAFNDDAVAPSAAAEDVWT